MAIYTSDQLKGKGTSIETLTSGSVYTFNITSSISGSTYFTLETVRNPIGFYDSLSLRAAEGKIENLNNIQGIVSSSYIFSVVINEGGGSFTFSPSNDIPASGSFLRGTGGVSLTIS